MESKTENRQTFGLSALAMSVWAIVLLTAFFMHRGDDVGQLGRSVGNIGGGPLFGPAAVDSLAGIVMMLLIAASWYGVGSLLVSRIRFSGDGLNFRSLVVAISLSAGAAIWSLVFFFLGLAGAYTPAAAIVAIIAGLALAAFTLRNVRSPKIAAAPPEAPSFADRVLILLISVPVVLAIVAALAPPTAKDALLYHFAVPKAFIAQQSNAFIEGNIASYMALGTESHIVWAMLAGGLVSPRAGEAAAGATIWLFFPIILIFIFGWVREMGLARRWALIATLMFAAIPTAYHIAASGYIDIAWSLSITLAIYALTRWWRSLEVGWLLLISIFLGAALSAKLLTVFTIAAFALVMVLRVRKVQNESGGNTAKVFTAGMASLVFAVLFAFPSYLRTWIGTGSPLFPFYMSVWPGSAPGWDTERSNLLQAMNSQYGGYDKTIVDILLTPWNLSVAAQPEAAVYFDGVLGVAFLLGLPVLIWAVWKLELRAEAKVCAGIAAVLFLFWMSSSQQLRYLLPILPALAVAIVVAMSAASERIQGFAAIAGGSLAVAAAAGVLVSAAWFLQNAPLRVTLGGETRESYLTRNIDYYPYYQWLNTETEPTAKVWLIDMRRDSYHLERPYFSDYLFEDLTLQHMVREASSTQELKAKTVAMGIKYVLVRHDFLLDPKVSPIVDERRSRSENDAKMRLTKEFLLDKAAIVRADQRFSLIKVF